MPDHADYYDRYIAGPDIDEDAVPEFVPSGIELRPTPWGGQ